MSLSLDDFEWDEQRFDDWILIHKTLMFPIARITNFNGWHVQVFLDPSFNDPLHVDSLDAAKAITQITAQQHMEQYHERLHKKRHSERVKKDGPPPFRAGVFKVD